MKVHRPFLLSLLMFASIGNTVYSQIKADPALQQRLQGKTNFYAIQKEVDGYFRGERARVGADTVKAKSLQRQQKFWNRWLWWAENHVDEQGNVVTNSAERMLAVSKKLPSVSQLANARSAYGDWQFRGPHYVPEGVGRVNRIAFHPTNPNIVYAGTSAGGLWRLTWLGSFYSWTCLTNHIPELSISGIVVSHANANVIYILTGDGDATAGLVNTWGYRGNSIGVLKSTDGGFTWSQTGTMATVPNTPLLGFQLVQDPNNANVLVAATNQGIYRTSDGGNSWDPWSQYRDIDNNVLTQRNIAYDVEFKPGSSTILYAAYQKTAGTNSVSIFKSENGGGRFDEKLSFSGVNRMGIAVTPANSSFVYLVCGPGFLKDGDPSTNTFRGLYFSNNSGESFSEQTNAPDILGAITPIGGTLGHQSSYDLAIAASPNNPSIVMVGGLIVWKSENKGLTFDEMTDYWSNDPDDDDCIHPDVHDLAYNPLDGRLYAATDGGVAVSSDHGDHFANLFNGLQIGQFYHFEAVNEDGNIWGGTQDCGVLEQDNGTQYFVRAGGDGYDVLTDRTGNNDDSYMVINSRIYDDSPYPFNNITPPSENEFFPLIDMHPTNEDILYAGYTNGLYVSKQRGDNWVLIDNTSARWALTVCPSNPNRVYCAGNNGPGQRGLFRVDGSTLVTPTVTNLTTPLMNAGYPNNFPKITGIAVNPSNSSQVWITIGSFTSGLKVLYSANAGADWENRSGSLPNVPANCILTDASGNTYVGTDIGVFYRNNSMNDWTPFYNDLPRVAVTGLEFLDIHNPNDPANPFKYIYASTFGRGIWRSQIYQNCSPTLSLSQTLQGQQSFQASGTLSSTSTISAGIGTEVYFQSGNNITLTPGFQATEGVLFKSMIRPCTSGPLYPTRTAMLDEQTGKPMNSDAEQWGRMLQITQQQDEFSVHLRINQPAEYILQLVTASSEPVPGKTLQKFLPKGESTESFQVEKLPAGLYYVELTKDNQVIHRLEANKN